jgi:hypothetical protein
MENDNELKIIICNGCLNAIQANRKKCSACDVVYYCSVECQKNDWANHKKICTRDDDLIAIKNLFSRWYYEKDATYKMLLAQHEKFQGTILTVLDKKKFLRCVKDLDSKISMEVGADKVVVYGCTRKAVPKNLAFMVVYYRQMTTLLKERFGLTANVSHLCTSRHLILYVQGTELLMDLVVKIQKW